MIVSGEQQRDSVIHIHGFPPYTFSPQTPISSRLPHNIEQSYVFYTVGFCSLYILNIAEYMLIPSSLASLFPHSSPSPLPRQLVIYFFFFAWLSFTQYDSLYVHPHCCKCHYFKNTCMCACFHFSCVRLLVTPWPVSRQAPLSVGFSRQEYWSRLPCPPLGDLPDPGMEPASLTSPALAGCFFFFTTSASWE